MKHDLDPRFVFTVETIALSLFLVIGVIALAVLLYILKGLLSNFI